MQSVKQLRRIQLWEWVKDRNIREDLTCEMHHEDKGKGNGLIKRIILLKAKEQANVSAVYFGIGW